MRTFLLIGSGLPYDNCHCGGLKTRGAVEQIDEIKQVMNTPLHF